MATKTSSVDCNEYVLKNTRKKCCTERETSYIYFSTNHVVYNEEWPEYNRQKMFNEYMFFTSYFEEENTSQNKISHKWKKNNNNIKQDLKMSQYTSQETYKRHKLH